MNTPVNNYIGNVLAMATENDVRFLQNSRIDFCNITIKGDVKKAYGAWFYFQDTTFKKLTNKDITTTGTFCKNKDQLDKWFTSNKLSLDRYLQGLRSRPQLLNLLRDSLDGMPISSRGVSSSMIDPTSIVDTLKDLVLSIDNRNFNHIVDATADAVLASIADPSIPHNEFQANAAIVKLSTGLHNAFSRRTVGTHANVQACIKSHYAKHAADTSDDTISDRTKDAVASLHSALQLPTEDTE